MKHYILFLLIFFCLQFNLQAQTPNPLFTTVDNSDQILENADKERFQNLAEENVIAITLINLSELSVNIKNLNSSIPIQGKLHVLSQESLRFKDSDNFTFKGQLKESLGEIYLYQNNGYLYGMIHIENQTFQIEPINRLYAVLLQRDFSEAICPLGQDHSHEDESNMKEVNDDSEKSVNSFSGTPTIDVMVIFSNEAAASNPNMEALAEGSIQSSNDSFSNSNIDVNFNLIHYQQVSYSESGNTSTDLIRLEDPNDNYMDDVHWLRDVYGADVVVLIIDNGGAGSFGQASGIFVGSNKAFAVVVDFAAIGQFSFAHEIGHLAGARHDNDNASDSGYDYAHGYKYTPDSWRTVMAVFDDDVNRIPYWSNPDENYNGVAMGTSSWNDNARVWGERAATLAGFKSPLPPSAPTGVNITNANSNFGSPYIEWNYNPEPNISYYEVWRKKRRKSDLYIYPNDVFKATAYGNTYYDGQAYFDQFSAYEYSYYVIAVNSFDLKSSASSLSQWVSLYAYQLEHISDNIPIEYSLNQNFPNPFNPATTITFELPEQADVTLEVYNIMGRRVALLLNETREVGFHSAVFNNRGLASGTYIARIQAKGVSGETFSKEMKMVLLK